MSNVGSGKRWVVAATAAAASILMIIGSAITAPTTTAVAAPGDPEPTATQVTAPRLLARATLSADYLAPGPQSGAQATPANGRTGPFDGQVIPGFSAAVANGNGTFWAMPDNGFGTKANSADFLLRIYLVRPRWERAGGGTGAIQILRYLTLSDPYRKINFPIVRENTPERLLTGGDFDIESLQRTPDGTFWIGEEFGPFLLHVDAAGRVLSRPVPFPLGGSPQNPLLGGATAATQASGGFEAMALSPERALPLPDPGEGAGDRARPATPGDLGVRHPGRALHRTHLGLPGRHRHQPGRRRPVRRAGTRCWCSSATTSTATRRSPSGSTGST